MYSGLASKKLEQEKKRRKREAAKAQIEKNAHLIQDIYINFQKNLSFFAKQHKDRIKSDSKFRDKFNDMCQEFDVNPMLAEKNIWAQLGFGDFYHQLAMNILDICAKKRHQNGGIMRIDEIIKIYSRKENDSISKNDVIRALEKTNKLGNVTIIDNNYVCTVPLQLNNNLSLLLEMATKYGFISHKILSKEKKWSKDQFEHNIKDLRTKGIVWVDKKVNNGPHYYFLSHLGTDFSKFRDFINSY